MLSRWSEDAVIEEILPNYVIAVETREDWLDVELFPDEEAALGHAVEKRRREFVTARGCARRALEQLGFGPTAIPSGSQGEPRWPKNVIGSITHCRSYRACALALDQAVVAVGIDAEPNEALPDGVLEEIANSEERVALGELARSDPSVHWDRLVFCAKETVYKTWFPLTKRRLSFEDATVTFDRVKQAFHARLLVAGPPANQPALAALDGRWLARDGLVLTAIAIPRLLDPGAGSAAGSAVSSYC